tara:strand:+ start:68 stop:262 length:195 start_codon:yes stop_codon:yes gene_type:complete
MTLYKLKLYILLYWSTFLSYFKKKENNKDVFIYENDILEREKTTSEMLQEGFEEEQRQRELEDD